MSLLFALISYILYPISYIPNFVSMLAIKLQRIGKKHQPSYRIVVAEKRSKLGAPPVEDLGSYNTFSKKAALRGERISYWIAHGAKPTVTVHNLFVREGALANAAAIKVKMKRKKSGETVSAAAPVAGTAA